MSAPPGEGAPAVEGHVAVCGGGLVGSSLVLALRAAGRDVRVHDADPEVRQALRTLLSADVADSWVEAAADASVVVAAVPPRAIPTVLAEAVMVARPSALLTDVAGVKQAVIERVAAGLSPHAGALARYVGGHPMAGSERSGPSAADATLFSGATWVLTPTVHTADDALARAGDLVRSLGARVLVLGAEEHDTIVGLVSHLPQLVASVLADVAAEAVGSERDAVMAVAGPGFRDTTRIAASDPDLWLDIIDGNRAAVTAALAAFTARLEAVRSAVDEHDDEALAAVLRRASEARRRLLPKDIDDPTRDVLVPLRDRPGEIARITAALGSAGINIEDLAMRHATAADRGALLLRVRADAIVRAITVLSDADVQGVVVEDDPADGPAVRS